MDFSEAQAPLIVAGVLILAGILVQLIYLSRKRSCTEQADGVVTGYDEIVNYSDEDKTRTTYYRPICQYGTGANTVTSSGIHKSQRRKFSVGQSVSIFYDPNNESKFYIAGEAHVSALAVVLLVIGAAVLVVGIAAGLYLI